MMRLILMLPFLVGIFFLYFVPANSFQEQKKEPIKVLAFEVPPGFEVTQYADDSLATDIFSMTIDSHGRVVVAGKGYIKILHDTDKNGRADKATTFADFPKSGAHGMCFDGNDLICDGDNGVRRLYDTNGDGKCDKVSPVWIPTTHDGDHAANGIIQGPDGWFYLITGNDAGICEKQINLPSSPVKEVNSGVVVRLSPDGSKHEVVAHGFRNPYDMDFNPFGHMFTVDADGERVHQMPYYTPNRLFDIAQGRHHGWILPGWRRSWSRPQSWPDNVQRLLEIGRGSPTGVTVYRHQTFPQRYRNGVFSLCWTFGRVYFFPLERSGSTYRSKKEIFIQTTGDVGFAPTDLAVAPNGDLFVSIGGRGTRGSVFRVHYKGKSPSSGKSDPLRKVLTAPQPLSSWSRAHWLPLAKQLGKGPFLKSVEDKRLSLMERLRAVEILTEVYEGVPIELAKAVCEGKNPELTARVIWSLSRTNNSLAARQIFVSGTKASDPRTARAAWEALQALPTSLPSGKLIPSWRSGLNSKDRRVRSAALLTAQGRGQENFLYLMRKSSIPPSSRERLALLWIRGLDYDDPENIRDWFNTCLAVLSKEEDPSVRLEAVRLIQIGLGDIYTDKGAEKEFYGYVARSRDKIGLQLRKKTAAGLAEAFPSGDKELDRELARTLGMVAENVPGIEKRIATKWTENSHPKADIHYLLVLSQLPGERPEEVSKQTAFALANLHPKLAKHNTKPTDQVPSILEKVFQKLLRRDPGLAAALVAEPAFGVPGHELFANLLPKAEKQTGARNILAKLTTLNADHSLSAWNADLVRLITSLPDDEALPILRRKSSDPRLRDSIALVLAGKGKVKDRGRLIEAMNSTQANVVQAAAKALAKFSEQKATPLEIGKAVRALRRTTKQKAGAETTQALAKLLTLWVDAKVQPKNSTRAGSTASAWVNWFTKTHPKVAHDLPGLSDTNIAFWRKRLAKIDWSEGDTRRGEMVFQQKSCFRCHGGARRLGPDLSGAAQRFSREDLFTAIIDPNKDISPAYRPTVIGTTSGKVYSGMVIYTSPALTLLQVTPDTTVRIPQEELAFTQRGTVSFMPSGLLDDVSDADLADLYAYLKSLKKN